MNLDRSRILGAALLVVFTLLVTFGAQRWIGGMTVYGQDVEHARLELYSAILKNQPPEGKTWESLGARNTNTRIGVIWLTEGLHRAAGIPVAKALFLVDTLSLWVELLLLFVLLRQWLPPIYCLVGVFYLISVLPLSYLFFFFHPWDRLSQVGWILLLLCIKRQWFTGLVLVLAATMLVKFDTVVVPGLYWLANVSRVHFWRVTLRAALLSVLTFGILFGLVAAFPGGASQSTGTDTLLKEVIKNFQYMAKLNVTYPPLQMHFIPLVLAFIGWSRADQVARAAVVFGVVCLVPLWFVGSNFHEVRAQLPLTILLLPAALLGLQRIMESARPTMTRTA
jgi:hypothetical protein